VTIVITRIDYIDIMFIYNEVSQVQPVRLLEFDQQFLANLRYAEIIFVAGYYIIYI
jgi:hypothetical protein